MTVIGPTQRLAQQPATPDPASGPAGPAPTAQHRNQPAPTLVGRAARISRDSARARRLDAFMRQMRGPYRVAGKTLEVPAVFYSNHGENLRASQTRALSGIKAAVGAKAFQSIATAAARATSTRGSPKDIRITVQALIDAGQLDPSHPPEQAVRALMKSHHIGIDCRGFCVHAYLFARGTGNVPATQRQHFKANVGNVLFQHEPGLARISIAQTRPGDIIRLLPDAEGRDHNVIVRTNRIATVGAPRSSTVELAGKRVPSAFLSDGWPRGSAVRIRVLEVDSSWGDGGDSRLGGAERRVWLYNEKSKLWASWDRFGALQLSPGPYGHRLDRAYSGRP